MKRLFLFALFAAFAVSVQAQNWTTVTASNITDLNQQKLANGQLCFLGTDQNDVAISFAVGGGGQILKRPFCSAVTNGIATSFTVPNPSATSPAGIYYRVTARDLATGQEVLRYTQVTFTGATFAFDNYAPLNLGQFAPPSGNAVNGSLSVSGNLAVTGSLNAGSFSAGLLGATGIGLNGAAANSNAINGPAGWTLQAGGANQLTVNSSGVTASSATVSGSFTQSAGGTATSTSNFGSGLHSWNGSYWNGTTAVADSWTAQSFLAAGTNPNSFLILNHSGSPGSFFQVNSQIQMPATTAATSSANVNSPAFTILGNYWTGTASNSDIWSLQNVLGTGANPASTLTISHTGGSSGATAVDLSSASTVKASAIAATGAISLGTVPATTGAIRLSNNTGIAWRNSANTADLVGLTGTSGSTFQVGFNQEITTNGGVTFSSGAANRFSLIAGTSKFVGRSDSVLGFNSSATDPTIAPDTGISRTAAGTLAIGNGNAADATGTLKLAALNNGGTLSLPTSTDTLVGRATVDTLTNKTLTSPVMTSPIINTGVGQGGGVKHQRWTAGVCTTPASAGSTCFFTLNWTTAFPDTNYTPVCTFNNPSNGTAIWSIAGWFNTGVQFILTSNGLASTYGGVQCVAFHD